ncbi:serine/threonine-protein kinase LATS1 isoform X2 [Rhinatrema bivittatum]|uniref:serine/threonine-protein kinase LATS1 isoform X2 n=1 Tax=Rhinatrema bivittatum TaxID=194408 RepID=UPI00112A6556|nr:serine/threonine-protein kinase LATS1 isoform X2 [Rhinatrema bivittatum]
MKRGEKPEGFRQMRPKTFPASNYPVNSRQMLLEIRESLRNLPKPSDAAKAEHSLGKMTAEDPRQGRNPLKFGTHHKALQEIRNSLEPFAHEASSSSRLTTEVNQQMLQELQAAGFDEDMIVRALRQTNSRSLEAAIEYISKMSYQESFREQMVAARPLSAGMKPPGNTHQSVNRRQSWKGSKESLVPPRHGPPLSEGSVFRSESPNSQTELGRPLSGSGVAAFAQAHPSNGQRVNPPPPPQVRSVTPPPPPPRGQTPPPRGTTPPPPSWDSNSQTKRYSGSMEYMISRISPVPAGTWPDGYPPPAVNPVVQGQRTITPVPVGRQPIIMHSSANNKFSFSSARASLQNGSNGTDFMVHQNAITSNAMSRQPLPPYHMSATNRQSPTALQMQAGGPVTASAYTNGNLPQAMMVPNRNSHNMELYSVSIPGMPTSWPQASSALPQPATGSGHETPAWQVNIPVRSNSFNTPLGTWQSHANNTQSLATTVTAITPAPIQQPVKSMRVLKPELQTALAPTHPSWMPQPVQSGQFSDGNPTNIAVISPLTEAPNYQGPPPPYPKHLLQQNQSVPPYESSVRPGKEDQAILPTVSSREEEIEKNYDCIDGTDKERKQITTSPVPVRRNKRDEERRESRIQNYSPQAFKFFMEQHVENILKSHHQRLHRKKQLETEMMRVGLSQEAQDQMRKMLCQKESNYIRLRRAKMEKSMFKKIKTLGIGAFGEVCLARKVDTNALYARKTLRKKDVLLRNQVAHVKAERDILAEADNEWVVRLYYSFQDKDNLYFIMDYIPGGDMMSLLIRMGIFPEDMARFYISELTCAVESVHKMGFIHRDIKPDNILIDRDGHIKLTDFGLCTGFRWTHDSKYYQSGDHPRQDSMDFSSEWGDPASCRCGDRLKPLERRAVRQHQRCLAHSLVGTPNYIAPEVLLRTGYTQLCDWWSVGVILFEMLVGQPPFLAQTPLETQLKVINWQTYLHIPPLSKLTPEASDLIIKLCRGPDDRLGKNGADEIKAHPFFKSIDFSSDLRQQPALYIPRITHPMDTSNFDPVDPDKLWSDDKEDNVNDTLNGWYRNGKHPEHAFYEFTFRRFFDDNGYPYNYPKPIEYDYHNPEKLEDQQSDEEEDQQAQKQVQNRDLVYV